MNNDLIKAKDILTKGGAILYPTDTIWGIGCDATNTQAVEKIFMIKERNLEKSMILLVDHVGRIPSYVKEMPDIAWDLIEQSVEPLTIIYSEAKNLPPNLVANDNSIGIRVTKDIFCKKLISMLKKPIVSTSANISNEPPPRCFNEINKQIINQVDYVVSYRKDEKKNNNKPSAILKVGNKGEVMIIRR